MRRLLRISDAIASVAGEVAQWFIFAIVLLVVFDVVMRYAFGAPTMWAHETILMLGGCMYALAWTYTHQQEGHVRVDIFYTHLPPRGKVIVDVIGGFVFWLPLLLILLHSFVSWAWRAWSIGERSTLTFWYPPMAPFRTVVAIGFLLLTLLVFVRLFRDLYQLIKGRPYV